MTGYQPYLVANMRHGLDLSMEPWLIPQDAFSEVRNGFIRRGVLQKRQGYPVWQRFVYFVEDEYIGASGSTNYVGDSPLTYIDNTPIRPGSVSFTDGTQVIDDDGDGTVSGDGTGTIDYTTGAYDITFNSATTGTVTSDYSYYESNPIVGIKRYTTSTGTNELLVWDTKRCNKYDSVDDRLEDVTGADEWDGSSNNFIHGVNWKDLLFVVNNTDRLKYYNGTTFTDLMMDIDDDSNNNIDTCLLVFAHKERLIVFRTTEGGTAYPQRARWCKAGDYTNWIDGDSGGTGGYVDAPTNEFIMGGDFIGDDIIIFFENSVWKLRYTANAALPFRWEKISSEDGTYSPFSVQVIGNRLSAMASTYLIQTDGLSVDDFNDKIPDLVLDIDQSNYDLIYSGIVKEKDQLIMIYPSVSSSSPDEAIVFNYKEGSFSVYDYPFTCFGYYTATSDLTLDDYEETFDELEIQFDDPAHQAGFPTVLAGSSDGYIYQLNTGSDDNGSAINFYAKTGRLNPFVRNGRKARLGYVDFLIDRDPGITVSVDFYMDQRSSPYLSEQFVCESDNDNEDKIWIRVYSGAVADFHLIKITNNATGQTPVFHAFKYWFKPAGRIN